MSNQKNILIFCDVFVPPAFGVRIRYFFSYLVKKGWHLTLIYEYHSEQKYIPTDFPAYMLDYYRFRNNLLFRLEWIFKVVLNLFFDDRNRFFYKKSLKTIENKHFDLVLATSSFNSCPFGAAAKIAQKMQIPFVADIRDIIEQAPKNDYVVAHKPHTFLGKIFVNRYRKVNINRRNKALKIAKNVTSISKWHVEKLQKINPETQLVLNGFDETIFIPAIKKTEKFTISYFGSIYNEKLRNPEILFAALKNLAEKNLIFMQNFVVQWYSDKKSHQIIAKFAKKFNICNSMSYQNFIPHENLPEKMNESSILLSLCNSKESGVFGMMTTKFFEYIGANRPILCTPNNNDELAQTINSIGCGLASSNAAEVENFILEKYTEWQKNGFTQGSVSAENREKFSRKNGAEILEKIFSAAYL
ncbi:MAG: hypothetical protein LBS50_02695 [Prevotellaceae bacterium]|jgi:glycosyltransferase involved in cell wall biosynthesis|nr:hypothetical protein [Prevotellaceae bacterium]